MARGNLNNFRARKQKSGRTFYYFDAGGSPRKEIPLGSDYRLAVRKWSELSADYGTPAPAATFIDVLDKYESDALPELAASTQATQKSDLKHLREFFGTPPAPIDQIKPHHIHQMLEWKKSQPTTANRLKRLFSRIFNLARAWGFTERENPVTGIQGHALGRREVYVTDEVFRAVRAAGSQVLQDAMDLAYLTGQRPGDVLKMTERDIEDGVLVVGQSKTGAKRRIRIEGELAALLERLDARKRGRKVWCANLAVNSRGLALTKTVLRDHYEAARAAAAEAHPEMADAIKSMWFYDLRAKAADDTADLHDDQAAANLLGHASVQTTKRHYLRRGKVVRPTK